MCVLSQATVFFSFSLLLLALSLTIVDAQSSCTATGQKPQVCNDNVGTTCLQSNFSSCNVLCNHTGDVSISTVVSTCQAATFSDDSVVQCSRGACQGVKAFDSEVECGGGTEPGSCTNGVFTRSSVTCLTSNDCTSPIFYHSAVSCGKSYDCGYNSVFKSCSCSFDASVTEDRPSCNDPLAFCTTQFLGRNCQEWGNPVCQELTVGTSSFAYIRLCFFRTSHLHFFSSFSLPLTVLVRIAPTGKNVTICTQGDCQLASFDADNAVWCDNRNAKDTCKQSEFTGTQVDCDVGSCENSRFTESSVVCHDLSCHLAHFDRTTVDCDPNYDVASSENTCMQASIFASDIIVATHSLDIADLGCNCCEGTYCPATATQCKSDPPGFCQSTYLGVTCQQWGNPVCKDLSIETSSGKEFTACTRGGCNRQAFKNSAVLCDNNNNVNQTITCNAIQADNSSILCHAGACSSMNGVNSRVVCSNARGEPSCPSSSFTSSRVHCYGTSCENNAFVASAVFCDTYSCIGTKLDGCSCCEGNGCPDGVNNCATVDLSSFCSTCASNPNCFNVTNVSPVPATATPTVSAVQATMAPTALLVPAATATPTVSAVQATTAPSNPVPIVSTPPTFQPTPDTFVLAPVTPVSPPMAPAVPTGQPLKTSTGDPVVIQPPPGGSITATEKPSNGSLIANGDGTITYIPNDNFVGKDSFLCEQCSFNSVILCNLVVIFIEVSAAQSIAEEDEESSSKGLYGLAALVLIPIIVVVVFLFRENLWCGPRQPNGDDQGKAAPSATTQTSNRNDSENPPETSHNIEVSSSCNTGVAAEVVAIVATGERVATAPQEREITVLTSALEIPPEGKDLPDNKDQCRSVPLTNRKPPIVDAVLIDL